MSKDNVRKLSRDFVIFSALAGMLNAGCGDSRSATTENPKPTIESTAENVQRYEEQAQAALEKVLENYNTRGLEEKEKILGEIYGQAVKLVPVKYNYNWKGSDKFGSVTVGIEGSIGVYKEKSVLALSNYSRSILVDKDGKIRTGFFEVHQGDKVTYEGNTGTIHGKKGTLGLPEGYSILFVRELNPRDIGPMLGALAQFGNKHPDVGITPQGVTAVRDGIKSLGYATNPAK